jgi:hypothetical protein
MFYLLLLLLLVGCQDASQQRLPFQTIHGRGDTPIYQISVPASWERQSISTDTLKDTTQPIAAFLVANHIRITIHNFPEQKIPPIAQVQRWKKQFLPLYAETQSVTPVAWGGFHGLFLEGAGLIQGQETTILAWAMQIGREHEQMLDNQESSADYTIKVVGPTSLINPYRQEIIEAAESFALIEEIPTRT